ncbi:dna methylase [Escherichia coli]|nr:dna methylase [Escherichia coli]
MWWPRQVAFLFPLHSTRICEVGL